MTIELGCGDNAITGSTPDILTKEIDFRVDVGRLANNLVGNVRLLPFLDNSVDAYVSQHLIEHLDHKVRAEVKDEATIVVHLKEVYRSLKEGGHYETMCPNLAYLAYSYVQSQGQNAWDIMQGAMGGQKNEWDYHYIILDFNILRTFATQAGFKAQNVTLLHPFDWFGLHVKMEK